MMPASGSQMQLTCAPARTRAAPTPRPIERARQGHEEPGDRATREHGRDDAEHKAGVAEPVLGCLRL